MKDDGSRRGLGSGPRLCRCHHCRGIPIGVVFASSGEGGFAE